MSPSPSDSPGKGSLECCVGIVNRRGLHARAAAKFVKTAEMFDATVAVSRNGQTVSGISIMGLMMLAAAPGTEIDISVSGPARDQALDALRTLVENGFDEED